MKKKWLLVGSLAFAQFFAKAQHTDSTSAERLRKTDIEFVYNQYMQDGSNSAVTGGIGTEELTVYGPAVHITETFGKNAINYTLGADVISSASTDMINDVMSSASAKDVRSYANAGYKINLKNQWELQTGLNFSIESDYTSFGGKIGISKESSDKMKTYAARLQLFFDDLRWGRINEQHLKPVSLIYPEELRFKEWYDVYRRNTYKLSVGYTHILNKRNTLGLFPEITLQQGLLATPFHRIYFANDSLAVEQLPKQRFKAALGIKLNSFVGGNMILKNSINTYVDDFGILGISLSHETAIKLNAAFTVLPNARFYNQKASRYFAPYMQHQPDEPFYTSDYDLSAFNTLTTGLGLKYSPFKYLRKRWMFNAMIFRYSYMHRSNGLEAHIISVSFAISVLKN